MKQWYHIDERKPVRGRWFIGKQRNPYRSDVPPYIAYQMHEQTPIKEISYWMYIPEED